MLRQIDNKFRSFTQKVIFVISRLMVLIFCCIVIANSAKYTAKTAVDSIVDRVKVNRILFVVEPGRFSSNELKSALSRSKLNFENTHVKKNFDIIVTDKKEIIESLSDGDSLLVLDFEFLKNILKDSVTDESFIPTLGTLQNYIITQDGESEIFIGVSKFTKSRNESYNSLSKLLKINGKKNTKQQ